MTEKTDSMTISPKIYIDRAKELAAARKQREQGKEFIKVPTYKGYKLVLKSK